MLAADKDRLVAALKKEALTLRQKELEYYVERYSNITTQASIIAGFSFDALVELDITEEMADDLVKHHLEWIQVVYYTAGSMAMAFSMYTVCVSSFATVYGHRLALQGPSGSVERSVAVLMKQRNQIFATFGISLLCLVTSAIAMAWIKMGDAAAGATAVFLFLLCALIYKHQELKRLFAIPKEHMVRGDVKVGGAGGLDVARLNEHSVAQPQGAHDVEVWARGHHHGPKHRWLQWGHKGVLGRMAGHKAPEAGPNALDVLDEEQGGSLQGNHGI